MSGFSADWLALRAGADDRARNPGLLDRLTTWADGRPLLITDLGGGTGATRRALAPRLPAARWRILDHDAALLAAISPRPDLEIVLIDLAAAPGGVFEPAPDLITASAFFDLVSLDWIRRLAARLAAARAPLYAALTYDGQEDWRPEPPHEARALGAFHRDMRADKGFGPALGPAAHGALAAALRGFGYAVHEGESDWRLARPEDQALIEALAAGGAAAGEVRAALAPAALRDWRAAREAANTVRIGHRDLLAFPPG
ncbi:class I SAM-dependent methyltransferase [Pikeienuella sp. HZG-20]|uniref:class I SAM-dependent methyltransferase n=1 Tax=Paludibacillus litoralis TaxID=3133267 RepID=UPI0030ECCEE7